jgi:hypothetical protein
MVATLLVASMIFSMPRLFCFLILMAYIISGPAYTLYLHRQGKTLNPEAADAKQAAQTQD